MPWGGRDDAATDRLVGLSVAAKNELLFAEGGVNFYDVPAWQKRGCGVVWRDVPHAGLNPKTGERVETTRRRLARDLELPFGDRYDTYLRERVAEATAP
ncbi:MAG: tRNAHis-5-guanylyltransferase [Phycisphaerales bacterium]|nr:tRNAHis-5-guanylyltransferase [Phycisphaerales bacterium]